MTSYKLFVTIIDNIAFLQFLGKYLLFCTLQENYFSLVSRTLFTSLFNIIPCCEFLCINISSSPNETK